VGQRIGYQRVSTVDQNTARQLDGVELDKMFTDQASGKDINRPELARALDYVRDGDTLVVHSMDRLARNLEDLRRIVRELTSKRCEGGVRQGVVDVRGR
jgi:DNA invertase Pin-like site-specific DNA recombinase